MAAKDLKQQGAQLIEKLNKIRGFSSDVIPYGLPGVTIIDIRDRTGMQIAKLSVSTPEDLRRAEPSADLIVKLYNSKKCQFLAADSTINSIKVQLQGSGEIQAFDFITDKGLRTFKSFINRLLQKTA